MNTTLTIKIPQEIERALQQEVAAGKYNSVNELIVKAVKRQINKRITLNGFTEEFETRVLKSASEKPGSGRVLETENDIRSYFTKIKRKIKR